MSIEKVKEYFRNTEIEGKILEFNQSSATVELAAQALNCEPDRIAKTLSFLIDNQAIIIVVSGMSKIDNPKYKAKFATKAKMIPFEQVENLTGHAPGGVCPFALNPSIKVYLDESLKKYDYVYPAAGSSNSAIKMTIPQLEKYSNSIAWIDVTKNMLGEQA